jgi:putative pyruvate formate lyase activating enzyme
MKNQHKDVCLEHYFLIISGGALPRFQLARRTEVPEDFQNLTANAKWNLHNNLCEDIFHPQKELELSSKQKTLMNLLHLKADLAFEIIKSCHLCERRCGVDRTSGQLGYCKVPQESYYDSEFIHIGEEPEIVPSHTIFFSGCTFRCMHCQNSSIIEKPIGEYPVTDDLASRIENRFNRGARNVNLVGGNPDQHFHNILNLFRKVNVPVPVVWNSNMYHSSESGKLMRGFVDMFLGDFKYGPGDCAQKISDVDNYWDVVTRNFLEGQKYAEIYIRHLLLPNHVECCTKPIMEWVSTNLPKAKFNLMFQYHPAYKAFGHKDLGRILSVGEKKRALEMFDEYGLNK